MSQEEYRNEDRRPAQSRGDHGDRRVAPSHPKGERRSAPRRRKKRFGGWGVLLYVIFVLGISAFLAGVGWIWTNDMLAFNEPALTAMVEIDEEDTVGQMADKLKEQDLIEYKMVFKFFCSLTHASGRAGEEGAKIAPGTYKLSTNMDYRALISSMSPSSTNHMATTIAILKGMTEAQIFALLKERRVSAVEQLRETAANCDFEFSFLKGVVPLGDPRRLEGCLFPDTYEFYMGEEPVSALNKMILRFDEIFTDEIRQGVQNDSRIIQNVVTMVSMTERETDSSDRAKVVSIIYSRLSNPTDETTGYLSIDITILYAIDGAEVDLNAGTPYNARTHKGLIPATITSPGVDALKAAVYPDSTKYYLYALGDDGKRRFFATYREQQNFIASQERYQND